MMEQVQSFSCRIDNVKSITDVLTCLSGDLSKDQPCYIEVTNEAIMLIVTGRGKASQVIVWVKARLSLQSAIFDEYNCRSINSIKLVLNLTILIDCLHMFGTASETVAATMSYSSIDAIFKLSLEESGVITDCDISCLYDDDFDELQQGLFVAFRDDPEECQIIVKSEPLKESIQELTDSFWVGSVQVEVNNNPAFMKLSTGGTVGASEVNIPRASDAFVSFRCSNPITSTYSLKSLLLGMKALGVSKETYIRINTKGIMCIQHQIETAKGIEVFFDFLMVSEENVE